VLGLDPFTVVKILVMRDEKGKPLIVLMHGNRNVSTRNLARQIGVKSVEPYRHRHAGLRASSGCPARRLRAERLTGASVHDRGRHAA